MAALQDFLSNGMVKLAPELPVMHTTLVSNFRSIISNQRISSTECNVFKGEKLLYYFYGKPAYKKNNDLEGSKEWQLPVCFILNAAQINDIVRIYPFDSGAFLSKRHPDYVTLFDIEEFNIGTNIDLVRALIGTFFEKIEDLYSLVPRSEQSLIDSNGLKENDYEVRSLRDLAEDTSLIGIDDRRFCVELQSKSDLILSGGVIDAVVIPTFLAEDQKLNDYISKHLGANIIVYRRLSARSSDHTFVIYEKIMDYLNGKGVV